MERAGLLSRALGLSISKSPSFRQRLGQGLFSWVPDFKRFLDYYFSEYSPDNPVYADPDVVWNTYLYNIFTNLLTPPQRRILEGLRREERGLLFGGRRWTNPHYYDFYVPPLLTAPFFFVPLMPGRRPLDLFNVPKEV